MKTTLPRALIASHLATRYARVGELVQLAEGEESQAFAAIADGQDIVVRTNVDRAGFDKDLMAAKRWPSVRAPAVRYIGRLGEAWLCISDRVWGVTLQALGSAAAVYGDAAVDIMAAMAASDVSTLTGWGPFDADGRGRFRSWQAFVTAVDGPADLVALVRDYRYGEPRQLVHGDFGSNNVLVTDGRVTGVIDWSEAVVGDPLYDLANLFFWRPWLDCMEAQCRHFELHHADRLAEARVDGDTRLAEWALARCRQIASS